MLPLDGPNYLIIHGIHSFCPKLIQSGRGKEIKEVDDDGQHSLEAALS